MNKNVQCTEFQDFLPTTKQTGELGTLATATMNVWDAAKDGRFDFVKYLLEQDPKQAHVKDENDVNALTYAVIGNQTHIVKLLIDVGEAKVNTPRYLRI